MTTNDNVHTIEEPRNLQTRTVDFEGHPITAVMFRGRWVWRGAEVGEAIGYENGARLVDKVRGEWAADFRDGVDYELLRGPSLKAFRELSPDSMGTSKFAGRLLVLTESGIDRALILSRTEKSRRLRDLLVDHILPQLRATGTATLPGAPAPAPVFDAAQLRDLVAATVAEQLRALVPQNVSGALPVLDRRDRAAVLDPMLRLARLVAGPGAPRKEVSRERSRIDHRVRERLGFEARWCFFPTVREGELVLALREEERIAERIAERAARERQLQLRTVGR